MQKLKHKYFLVAWKNRFLTEERSVIISYSIKNMYIFLFILKTTICFQRLLSVMSICSINFEEPNVPLWYLEVQAHYKFMHILFFQTDIELYLKTPVCGTPLSHYIPFVQKIILCIL